jgi:hypothetical protein
MPPSLIVCLRHAEKPANAEDDSEELDADGLGFDQHGSVSRHGLTIKGWQRACALATTRFAGHVAADVDVDDLEIFAPDYDDDPKQHRPYQTVLPFCGLWRVEKIRQPGTKDEIDELYREVMKVDGIALVCWEHDRLAEFVEKLVGDTQKVVWPGNRFDVILRLRPTADDEERYSLAWEDQRLVFGDRGLA